MRGGHNYIFIAYYDQYWCSVVQANRTAHIPLVHTLPKASISSLCASHLSLSVPFVCSLILPFFPPLYLPQLALIVWQTRSFGAVGIRHCPLHTSHHFLCQCTAQNIINKNRLYIPKLNLNLIIVHLSDICARLCNQSSSQMIAHTKLNDY